MNKVVVILSGGLDSTVLVKHHLKQGAEVRALGINYGQRHTKELQFAADFCKREGVPFEVADLHMLARLLPGSSQTDLSVPVPEGHYTEENMKATVVPNRNMIMLSVALGVAVAHKFDGVSYGAHAGDHAIYPDCRNEFAQALNVAAGLCDWHLVEIYRPFVHLSKAEIIALGATLGVDFQQTWSCYAGGAEHCGRCGTCVERVLAFKEAGIFDPTVYTDSQYAVRVGNAFDGMAAAAQQKLL